MGQHDVIEARTVQFVDQSGVVIVWTPAPTMSDEDFYERAAIISAKADPGTVMIGGAGTIPFHRDDVRDSTSGDGFVGETLQLSTSDLGVWAERADSDIRLDPDRSRRFATGLSAHVGSSKAAADAAAAAARQSFFVKEDQRIDAEYLDASRAQGIENRQADQDYFQSTVANDLESLARKRAYDSETTANSLRDLAGQTAFDLSQLDNNLAKLGLDSSDYRRDGSTAADPYRALEADQTGAGSGQRRYAGAVRDAATASEEAKIALSERQISQLETETQRRARERAEQLEADRIFNERETIGLIWAKNAYSLDGERLFAAGFRGDALTEQYNAEKNTVYQKSIGAGEWIGGRYVNYGLGETASGTVVDPDDHVSAAEAAGGGGVGSTPILSFDQNETDGGPLDNSALADFFSNQNPGFGPASQALRLLNEGPDIPAPTPSAPPAWGNFG
jgi:hypothetical protein